MLEKRKLRFIGKPVSFKIKLTTKDQLNGLQESIDDFIEQETGLSINPVNDEDKFRYLPTGSTQYSFNFYNTGTTSFSPNIENAGFDLDELQFNEDVIISSFYIIQIYDSISGDSQQLLHSGYFNGFNFNTGSTSTIYNVFNNFEFSNHYYSNNFIESLSGITTQLYARLFFYNAKRGILQLFLNEDNESLTTQERLYFSLYLNPNTREYGFLNNEVNAKEILNTGYTNKINDTLESINNLTPTFPTGNKFNSDGTYDTI